MIDGKNIVSAAARLRAKGEPFLVATVVRVHGSSYRKPGARLLATAERRISGSVSGGCLDGDLVRSGWWRTEKGPVVVRYDSSDPDEARSALGCGGIVDVLLQRAGIEGTADPLALIEAAIASERRAALATVFESTVESVPVGSAWCVGDDGRSSGEPLGGLVRDDCLRALASGKTRICRYSDETGHVEVLVERIAPPLHLFVLGAGFDAAAVADFAHRIGWNVTVYDALGRLGTRERVAPADVAGPELDDVRRRIARCGHAAAIVMGHDMNRDRAALEMLLTSNVGYIGILGPRHRADRLSAGLAPDLSGARNDPRIHAPVGLDLGAETPEEIALAITSEILATIRGADGRHLRGRDTIHVDDRG